jgi:hypothetical protein
MECTARCVKPHLICAWINEDVRSLDVAVHHAHAVQVGQAARRLVEDLKLASMHGCLAVLAT